MTSTPTIPATEPIVEIHVPLTPTPGLGEDDYPYPWIDDIEDYLAQLDGSDGLKKLDCRSGPLAKWKICLQEPGSHWSCSVRRDWWVVGVLIKQGRMEDTREIDMLLQQADLAHRRWGEHGYAEYSDTFGSWRGRGRL